MSTLADFIDNLDPKQHAMLDLGFFQKALNHSDRQDLFEELVAFSQNPGSALEIFGIYLDAFGEEHVIDGEEMEELLAHGTLICPVEGNPVPFAKSAVSYYWAKRHPEEMSVG